MNPIVMPDRTTDLYVWLTVRETAGPYQVDGAHLDEEAARDQAEKLAEADFPPGTVFSWAPVTGDDPDGPQVLFADTPDQEDVQTRHQVHWRPVRLGGEGED
ncbi:hypothetical protein ACIBK9_47285 [Nonomuraea sp. NPDC050227]|uniref:hypothetical protein n=1 Tax=Nonomuraea sp. NPDC050227 TaxID=3364360 RepID=UPI0037A6B8CB